MKPLLLVALLAPSMARASLGQAPGDSASRRHTQPLITPHQAKVAALAAAATIALAPFDRRLVAQSQRPRWQGQDELHLAATDLSFLGGPGPFIIGAAFIAAGDVANVHGVAAVGSRITTSVLLAASITALGKGITGRALPGVQTRHAFSFGRGFHEANGAYVSFPSGHTAAAFALAGAVTAEAERTNSEWGRFVRPAAFTIASGVAVARVYQHTHWASDLPLAAVIGMWSASTVEKRVRQDQSGPASKLSWGGVAVVPHGRRFTVSSSFSY